MCTFTRSRGDFMVISVWKDLLKIVFTSCQVFLKLIIGISWNACWNIHSQVPFWPSWIRIAKVVILVTMEAWRMLSYSRNLWGSLDPRVLLPLCDLPCGTTLSDSRQSFKGCSRHNYTGNLIFQGTFRSYSLTALLTYSGSQWSPFTHGHTGFQIFT